MTPHPKAAAALDPRVYGAGSTSPDVGDIVAVPKGVISTSFHGVDLDEHTLISAFDFYKAANYLAHKRLARILTQNLLE